MPCSEKNMRDGIIDIHKHGGHWWTERIKGIQRYVDREMSKIT